MKRNGLMILLIFVLMQTLNAQDSSHVLIIDLGQEISINDSQPLKEIRIERDQSERTKEELLQQCIDSTKFYGGNCFKILYFDDDQFFNAGNEENLPAYIIGEIYTLNTGEYKGIKVEIENAGSSNSEISKDHNVEFINSSSDVSYDVNLGLQFGGESKLAIFLPKIGVVRKHGLTSYKPYYGIELGVYPLFITGGYSCAVVLGTEISDFIVESSVSYYGTFKIEGEGIETTGPFSQSAVNLKFGVILGFVRLKVGTTILFDEFIPNGQERVPLLDLGKINGTIFGIELQVSFNSKKKYPMLLMPGW